MWAGTQASREEDQVDLSPAGLWEAMGWPSRVIFFVLVAMMFWCIYVGFERMILFLRARGQSQALAEAIAKPLGNKDIDAALKLTADTSFQASYLAVLLKAGLTEFKARPDKHGVEAVERALERVMLQEGASLRKGFNVLATTGSTAPFVGLVGTILGIINSFAKMGEAGGGDLSAVSGGIAEALVSTAIGIIVAIVGVWIYNYFNAVVDDITKDMTTSVQEILDWCEKEVLRRSEANAAK